ncbi:MAG TPA: hypothetical protein VF189_02935 [Patescibacteria group bacterium]
MSEWCNAVVLNAPGKNPPGECVFQRYCSGRSSDNGQATGICKLQQEGQNGSTVKVETPKGELPGIGEIQARQNLERKLVNDCMTAPSLKPQGVIALK